MINIRLENFKELVKSYVFPKWALNEITVELNLRKYGKYAKMFGDGCISCVFSRRYPGEIPDSLSFWIKRACVLGLNQDTCGKYLEFPEIE